MGKKKQAVVVAVLTAEQQTAVAVRMALAKEASGHILTIIGEANDAAVNVFQSIVAAHLSAITFDELEMAEPRLKEQGAYRQAKSVIKATRAAGIDIEPGMTAGEMRKAIAETKKGTGTGESGGDDGDAVTTSTPGANAVKLAVPGFAEMSDCVKFALARLAVDAGLRETFVAEIHNVNKLAQGELSARLANVRKEKQAA